MKAKDCRLNQQYLNYYFCFTEQKQIKESPPYVYLKMDTEGILISMLVWNLL